VRVSEAPGYGQSVLTYDPGSRGSTSYVEAARELAQRGAAMGQPSRAAAPVPEAPPVAALAFSEDGSSQAQGSTRTQDSQ
jgi:chromosome partitioning protein